MLAEKQKWILETGQTDMVDRNLYMLLVKARDLRRNIS